jgi:hypothetical protein
MKTVTTEILDPATLLIADGKASSLSLLSGIRYFIKTLIITEKSRSTGSDTRLVPVLR